MGSFLLMVLYDLAQLFLSMILSAADPEPASSSLSELSEKVKMVLPFHKFLGLRPLAGYASLKLYHVMSCLMHEKRSVCYDMAG